LIEIKDILQAQDLTKKFINYTHLQRSTTISIMSSNNVFIKPENFQKTGSFKTRGAINTIGSLSPDEKKRGVVSCSAGNWGQALAYAASLNGIRAVIFVPEYAPLVKINAIKGYGGEVIVKGKNSSELFQYALELQKEEGLVFLSPFDNEPLITGYGSLALEILNEKPDTDIIVCPIGGGALISGVALAAKAVKPAVKVIGVQPEGACSMKLSLNKGELTEMETVQTIADGLAVKKAGAMPFQKADGGRQAKPAACDFGGEEGLEDAGLDFRRHATAGI